MIFALINQSGQVTETVRRSSHDTLEAVRLLYPDAAEVLPYEIEIPTYSEDTHTAVKLEPVIQRASDVKPDQWDDAVAWTPTDHDRVVVRYRVTELDLTADKEQAKRLVSQMVDAVRQRYISPGVAKILEYQQNDIEATAILALPEDAKLDPAAYPMLQADVDAAAAVGHSITLRDVARIVANAAAEWRLMGAATKRIDQTAKLMLSGAGSKSQIKAAVDWCKTELGKIKE